MANQYRADLPPLPERMKHLAIDERGYPRPWFVGKDATGKFDPRVADRWKRQMAIATGACWVCGGVIRAGHTFVIGPMCMVNRVSAEPPCHPECAEYSVKACPFLVKPHMRRRENDYPEGAQDPVGIMIRRNPGVSVTWASDTYRIFAEGNDFLFNVGEPVAVAFWREGRPAMRAEIEESISTGAPLLRAACDERRGNTVADFEAALSRALTLLPAA